MVGREQSALAHAVVWPLLTYVRWRGAAAAHGSCASWDGLVLGVFGCERGPWQLQAQRDEC